MAERGTSNSRRDYDRAGGVGGLTRNGSRSAASSARSSGVFPTTSTIATTTHDVVGYDPLSHHLYPTGRFNPSLRSVGSRGSLSDQFAMTRKEYDFGFDDAVSFVASSEYEDEDGDTDGDNDSSLTVGGGGYDGVVVVPPMPREEEEGARVDAGERLERLAAERVHRSHYELLCLPEGGAVTEGDIRRAYFRLYDVLRSKRMPAKYRETAMDYFRDVQVAFETLIGKANKEEYDFAVLDEGDETSSEGENAEHTEESKSATVRRTNPRFVRKLRRQQEQESREFGIQLDAQPLLSQSKGPIRRRQDLPVAWSLTNNQTIGLPAVSQFLEPKARALRNALKGPATTKVDKDEQDLELYCTPPNVTISSSVFAAKARSADLPPASALNQSQNLIPDTLPKDRPLEWYSTYIAPLINLRFRQELFLRQPGLSEASLRQTLPDAVVEVETDALNAASLTARISHAVRLESSSEDDDAGSAGEDDEPVRIEASASVSRSWLARNYATRMGLAVHKRVSANGGTVFACADSGTSALWNSLSPASWQGAEQDGTGASWRSYMDQLSRSLGQGLMPYLYSPPTAEIGYRFSPSADDTVGLPSGRPFTKQARSGLRRLHDDVDLVDVGKGGSWTVSGAVSATGVAGYLRYGRDLFTSRSSSEDSSQPQPSWKDRLGFRMEAELTAQKMQADAVFSRQPLWGRTEIAHLAVRGLKKIGKSAKLGLELGASSASSSVVLSVYFSQRNNRRLVVPVMLFRDSSPLLGQHRSTYYTSLLFWSAFLPVLGLAAVDHVLAASRAAAAGAKPSRGAKKKGKRASSKSQQQAHDTAQRRITHRRAEADVLANLLAEPVQHCQGQRRERGGLVILSAKYGAPDSWTAPEGVADVTVAVAALVDGGGHQAGALLIPEGLRKSKLLGFWDPTPGKTKALVVKYLYGGREGTRAVSGREELRLP